ncbi:hypothetical protein ACFXTO_038173 [Malus domestica]
MYKSHPYIDSFVLKGFFQRLTFRAYFQRLNNATTQQKNALEAVEHVVAAPSEYAGNFWHLHVNDSSNYQASRTGLVLMTPNSSMLKQAINLGFKASNNEAKYNALLAGLRMAKNFAMKKLIVHSDS